MTNSPHAPLTADEIAHLGRARETLHALRDWPEVRRRWLVAIRAGEEVLSMSPEIAFDRMRARDRVYARAEATIARLAAPASARPKW
ncbi:MAG TPA: hypothetical protein VFY90_01615 [Tepidiformaceae bacterium]|nr:hypothetical protein [Tepidiformaceae bacterium]